MLNVRLLYWPMAIVGVFCVDGCAVKSYKQKLLPACDVKDLAIKWPNYNDQTKYYKCIDVNYPQLTSCPSGQVFVYVFQICTPCAQYLPAVECKQLPTQRSPVCVDINAEIAGNSCENSGDGVVTYPTPHYPSTVTTSTTPGTDDTSTSSDAPAESSTVTVIAPTTTFPGPPSPPATGQTTKVPMPPTPAPTPPYIPLTPPYADA